MIYKQLVILFLFLACFAPLYPAVEQNVDVSAEMDLYNLFENSPLNGTVIITHRTEAEVDTSSFKMDGKPLSVSFVKTVKMNRNSPVVVSIYKFQLPGKPQGLYVLSPITMKVGGNTYTTVASSYEVAGAAPAQAQTTITQQTISSAPATLDLKAAVEGPADLYPGMRTFFVYRFYFQGMIDLTVEQLPLLKTKDFLKIGDEQTKEYSQNQVSITEVKQEMQAVNAGEFKFPASFIEGYAYQQGVAGKKRIEPKLHSEAPAMTVTVLPFPAGQPSSFNGAIGQFQIQSKLLTPAQMHVDDKIRLAVDIIGDGNLHTVKFPDLSSAGFTPLFRIPNLFPAADIRDKAVHYELDLYPLTSSVKQIPALEFSSFDPNAKKYITVKTQPIPITVTEAQTVEKPAQPIEQKPVEVPQMPVQAPVSIPEEKPVNVPPKSIQEPIYVPEEKPVSTQVAKPAPVQIDTIYEIGNGDLYNRTFGTWNVFWIIPLGVLIFLAQIALRRYLVAQKSKTHTVTSEELFHTAVKTPFGSPEFFTRLNQAFMLQLAEKGEINTTEISPDTIPTTGYAGKVREFLMKIEENRFASNKKLNEQETIATAQQLFREGKD